MSLSQLTPADQSTVASKRRSEDALPEYFSATQQQDTRISRDFEAFLILAKDDLKTSAIQWIDKAVQINKGNKLRDDLTEIVLTNEAANSQLKLDEYDSQLEDFNEFRTKFQAQIAFADVPEVQLFLGDLQSVIEELIVGRDRAFFDQTVTKVMENFENGTQISDAQVEELQSWTSVISEYLGG